MREDSYEGSQRALTRYSEHDRLRQQARFDKPSRRAPAIVLTPLKNLTPFIDFRAYESFWKNETKLFDHFAQNSRDFWSHFCKLASIRGNWAQEALICRIFLNIFGPIFASWYLYAEKRERAFYIGYVI